MRNPDLETFRLYPRGFLGSPLGMRLEKKAHPFDAIYQNMQRKVNLTQLQVSTLDPNPNVERLYGLYVNQGAETQTLAFRRDVLIVAMDAFGTKRFDDWFQQQYHSPVAGDYHHRFLDDTLQFLRTGRRNTSLESWSPLLTVEDSGDHSSVISKAAKEFFGISTDGQSRERQNYDLVEVIQKWCSHRNGFEDLLGTMHILFGDL